MYTSRVDGNENKGVGQRVVIRYTIQWHDKIFQNLYSEVLTGSTAVFQQNPGVL